LRPKTRGLRPHQTRAHAALRHRGGDRTYESRGPSRPLLSQRSRRRCRQRHPQRRRLQPSPRSRLAEDHFARHPTRATPDLHNSASPQTGFLTGDYLSLRSVCPEAQPRELFADNPQLVFRVGFVELVDHPDQRADMLLGHLKELLRGLGRHRTSSGRTAWSWISPPCVLRLNNVASTATFFLGPQPDFRGVNRERRVSYFTLRGLSKN